MLKVASTGIPVRTTGIAHPEFIIPQPVPFLLTMEDALILAKAHGVNLSVGLQHQRSEASRAVIMKFLADMITLDTNIDRKSVV